MRWQENLYFKNNANLYDTCSYTIVVPQYTYIDPSNIHIKFDYIGNDV